jgi:hypothetical protein
MNSDWPYSQRANKIEYTGSMLMAMAHTKGLIWRITAMLAINGKEVATMPKMKSNDKFFEFSKSV